MQAIVEAFYRLNPVDRVYATIQPSVIDRYRNIVPDFLLEIWQTEGLTSHADGFFWLVNPEQYVEAIKRFIPHEPGLHVLLRTAFGGMVYLNEAAGSAESRYRERYLYLCPVFRRITEMSSHLPSVMNGWLTTEDICDELFLMRLYKQARCRLAPPKQDECYGFTPAIALGGDLSPDCLAPYKLAQHLNFLAQLQG